jgi:hypothetical protein
VLGAITRFTFVGLTLYLLCAVALGISVKDYGAVADGVTDDSGAIQLAINSANGDEIVLPAGSYFVGHPLSITQATTLRGVSREAVVLIPGSVGSDVIDINTNAAVHLVNFSIRSQSKQTGGSFVSVTAPAPLINSSSEFSNLWLVGGYCGFSFLNAALWRMKDCTIENCTLGAEVQDLAHYDAGDSLITASNFLGGNYGVLQTSSGGLRIENSKFNGCATGYCLSLLPGAATGDLFVVGCSIEGTTSAGIAMFNQGAGSFANVIISGDEFEAVSGWAITSFSTNGQTWLHNVRITGCTFLLGPGAGSVCLTGADNFFIDHN